MCFDVSKEEDAMAIGLRYLNVLFS